MSDEKTKRIRRTKDKIYDAKIAQLENDIKNLTDRITIKQAEIEETKKDKEAWLANPKQSRAAGAGRKVTEPTMIKAISKNPELLAKIFNEAQGDANKRYELLKVEYDKLKSTK